MKKTVYLFYCLSLLIIGSCHKSPYSSEAFIDIEDLYPQIMDITRSEDKYILMDSTFNNYVLLENGKVQLLNENSPKYFYDIKTNSNIPEEIDFQKYLYLCYANNCYYVCFFDWSWSSCFLKLDINTYNKEFFKYITGIPEGLYFYDDRLWYIAGTGDGGLESHSILHCFDTDTKEEMFSIEMDNINARGLYIDDLSFVVFDRNSKSFLSFIVDDSTKSILVKSETP